MKRVIFERCGEPAEVLEMREEPTPAPGAGQVLVRMIASPVNPSDLLYVRGRYTFTPSTPSGVGFEGVGVVEKAGVGLGKLWVGRRVCVINQSGGNWADYAVVDAKRVFPVAADLPDQQVASMFVNPATVLAMVRHVLKVPQGGWLLQSAAGSELGKMVIRLGKRDGFKTLNVVRRPEAKAALLALGADAVICSAEGAIDEQVRAIVPEGVKHALEPVGGETGTQMVRALAEGGTILFYGTLTGEPVCFHPRFLFGGGRRLEGFYLGWWIESQSIFAKVGLFREITKLIREGVLTTDVGPSFPLDRVDEAVKAAEQPGRAGKVLLRPT